MFPSELPFSLLCSADFTYDTTTAASFFSISLIILSLPYTISFDFSSYPANSPCKQATLFYYYFASAIYDSTYFYNDSTILCDYNVIPFARDS